MTFLPIVERELRVAARQASSWRLRFWTVAAAFGVGTLLLFFSSSSTQPHQLAQSLFISYGVLALSFCLIAGLFLTADCLSVEKREQTLGLLFLTDLKGYDVVLGKLATTSLQGVYALLGLFPVIAVPLLMGGVTGAEVVRLICVLLVTMLFSLSAGILVSALSYESRQAALGTLGLLIVICGIFPLLWWTVIIFLKANIFRTVLLYPCPVFTFGAGLDEFYRKGAGPADFWTSCAVVCALGLGFLAWACFLSSRIWQERRAGDTESKAGKFWRDWRYGKAQQRRKRRRILLTKPIYWLATRDRLMPRLALLTIAALLAVWLIFFFGLGLEVVNRRVREEAFLVLIIVSFGLHAVFKCFVALEASRRLSEDYQSGALELLACTPISNQQFTGGFRQAMFDQFKIPMLWLVLANISLALLIAIRDPVGMTDDKYVFFWIMLGGAALVVTDFYSLIYLSVRMALQGRRHHRVVLGVLGRVMLAPWAAIFLFFVVLPHAHFDHDTGKALVLSWFLGCYGLDAITIVFNRQALAAGFRRLVAHSKPQAQPLHAAFNPETGA